MLKNLSYRQKLKILPFAAVLSILICYKFGFVNTVKEHEKYSHQKKTAMFEKQLGYSFQMLNSREKKLNELLDGFVLDTLDNSKNLLSVATTWCRSNNLEIKEFKPYAYAVLDSMSIITQSLTVAGGFIDCLKLVNALETQFHTGKLSSVQYKSVRDPKTKTLELNCTLYIQNIDNYGTKYK